MGENKNKITRFAEEHRISGPLTAGVIGGVFGYLYRDNWVKNHVYILQDREGAEYVMNLVKTQKISLYSNDEVIKSLIERNIINTAIFIAVVCIVVYIAIMKYFKSKDE